jgi:excisionase family DNA binding protein
MTTDDDHDLKSLPRILTPEEVGALLKLPRKSVIRLCRIGKIPQARRLGRYWRIPESAIAAFFEALPVSEAVPEPSEPRGPGRPWIPDETPSGETAEGKRLLRREIKRARESDSPGSDVLQILDRRLAREGKKRSSKG